MGTGYENQVYYKLGTETQTDFIANSWGIAFLRTSLFNQGLVINDGIDIAVFEASNDVADWNTIDVTNESTWTQLYNSDTERAKGAFMQASATYGWGEYNVATHIVEGTTVYVLKYADGTYKKFICESYTGGNYSIKYASYDAVNSIWEEDQTAVISNATNEGNNYNYYSLQNNEEVVASPASPDWDLVFRGYTTDVGGGTMYGVTGVLQGDDIEVAKTTVYNQDVVYNTDINTIGYDWKSLNYTTFTFDVDENIAYYVKDADENVFKFNFTEFGGTATGDVAFKFENITATLGFEDLGENISFGVYPNPVSNDKKINVIFDLNKTNQEEYSIGIYNIAGQQVYQTNVNNTQGFYAKELDLNNLSSGVYMLKFMVGNIHKTQKIVVQ